MHLSSGTHTGLRTVLRSRTGLGAVARVASTLRVVAGPGIVAWISWMLWSSHLTMVSLTLEILLDMLRLREILSYPKPVDDHTAHHRRSVVGLGIPADARHS